MSKIELYQGDCLELMKNIPDKSVDMILCDLPFGVTNCEWDNVIPFEPLWEQYKRIIRDNRTIALFGTEPFSSMLRMSNIDMFKYDWIYEKVQGPNFMTCKTQPYKVHEIISIFHQTNSEVIGKSEKFKSIRDYLWEEKEKSGLNYSELKKVLGNNMVRHYFTKTTQFSFPTKENYKRLQSTGYFNKSYEELKKEFDLLKSECGVVYNPQMTKGTPYKSGTGNLIGSIWGSGSRRVTYNNDGLRYPRSIQKFNPEKGLHPTQKPVALLEYLIKTYTNEGETVLDNCMGSGSTGVACVNTNRNFIGMELDENYFNIAKERIEKAKGGVE